MVGKNNRIWDLTPEKEHNTCKYCMCKCKGTLKWFNCKKNTIKEKLAKAKHHKKHEYIKCEE